MKEDNELYLTDKQYLDLLKRIRKDLDEIQVIYAEDCTMIGYKHTITNVGLCASEETDGGWSKAKYVTRETAMWPKEFDKIGEVRYENPQMFTMKYTGVNHKCPLDARSNKGGDGCFYHCRAFKDKNLTIAEVKRLYDEVIAKIEGGKR